MKITMKLSIFAAAIFSVLCFIGALHGFFSLGDITDPKQLADARGFAWFWAFLGFVGSAFSVLGWWLLKTEKGEG